MERKEIKETDLTNINGGVLENNRDMDITPSESSIGTTSDNNSIAPEVSPKR